MVELGDKLFHDPRLSGPRTQSCATCHDPRKGFADARANAVGGAVSVGADGNSLGLRNAPAIAYAALVPAFSIESDGEPRGGLFLDGHAEDLVTQALGPLFDRREMALPNRDALVVRMREDPFYATTLEALYGPGILASPDRVAMAVATAIAAFERQPPFVAFDSRYDRYLAGEETLTAEEDTGRRLFFSDLVNCRQCHLLDPSVVARNEPFTNQRYHNIGIPVNAHLPARPADRGLGERDKSELHFGQFRTPTLRNALLSAPYMHNGAFRELRTVMMFYNHYIVTNSASSTNPESGAPWDPPEVAQNIDYKVLRQGQPLDDEKITALIAFLGTLTDHRYEVLVSPANRTDASPPSTNH